jgi:membrane protein YdbS with pleckstrin-like domain
MGNEYARKVSGELWIEHGWLIKIDVVVPMATVQVAKFLQAQGLVPDWSKVRYGAVLMDVETIDSYSKEHSAEIEAWATECGLRPQAKAVAV